MRGIVQGSSVTGIGDATASDVAKNKTCISNNGNITGELELTGTASVGKVAAGYTFYNTDLHTKETGTLPDKTGGGANSVALTYANQSVAIPAGWYDGTETFAYTNLVSSGANQVYSGSGGLEYLTEVSEVYYQVLKIKANISGVYKVTMTTTPTGFVNSFSVKVNGVEKTTSTGTINWDATLSAGDFLTFEAMMNYSTTPAGLSVEVIVSIAETVSTYFIEQV